MIRSNIIEKRQPTSASVHAVQELLRIVSATRDSQEIERKRRLAWEQEQEAKHLQKQAEMERVIMEMRQEISILRSTPGAQPPTLLGLLTPQDTTSSTLSTQGAFHPSSMSPLCDTYPSFIQGSSSQPFTGYQSYHDDLQMPLQSNVPTLDTPATSVPPSPSPQLTCVQPSEIYDPSPSPVNGKKRATSQLSSDDEGEDDYSDDSSSRPTKRINHHDKRCITIHVRIRPV